MRLILALSFLTTLLAATAAAQQQPVQVVEAQRRFELASQHYRNRDYALSLQGFQESLALLRSVQHPRAELVNFNIARCYEELGRDREAFDAYNAYLSAPNAAQDSNRADALQRQRELSARLALQPHGWSPSPIGFIVGGTGAAMMIAAIVTGSFALSLGSEISAACPMTDCPMSLRGKASDAHTLAITTDILLWGGLGVLGAGVVLLFVLQDSAPPPVTAMCDSHGCMASIFGSF